MPLKLQHRTIAIVVPPNAQLLDVAGPIDAFTQANRQPGDGVDYELCVVAMSANKMVRVSGASLVADASIFDEDRPVDTLLIAGTPDYATACENTDMQAWLRRRARLSRRFGAIGSGAFLLGAAGLLDGRSATTHWQHTEELAARYPSAKILSDHMYVEDGELYTTAGATAGICLALKLIEDDHGRQLAREVARSLVVSFKRPRAQSQFSTHLMAQNANENRIQDVQHWILDHLALDLTLKNVAGRAAMGVRHFTRVFQKETGTTPGEFIETARVNAARQMLEESDMQLQAIAGRCGFSNADVMRVAFLRRVGVRPSLYRETFRA